MSSISKSKQLQFLIARIFDFLTESMLANFLEYRISKIKNQFYALMNLTAVALKWVHSIDPSVIPSVLMLSLVTTA